MEIREIRPEDHPSLVGLWLRVFGDSPAFVEEYFHILPEIGGGVAAFERDQLLGAAYMLQTRLLASAGQTPAHPAQTRHFSRS